MVAADHAPGGAMTTADSLLLEAKQAILEEQHRRFRELQAEGRLDEALAQPDQVVRNHPSPSNLGVPNLRWKP